MVNKKAYVLLLLRIQTQKVDENILILDTNLFKRKC